MTDRKEFSHPSYGMIAFNRSLGGRPTRLFGSPLEEHYGTVRVVIGTGTRIHESNMDRYHGSLRGEHIEVEMSAAQFAEVLTSMNQGSGIPCTIRYIKGERIPDPPATQTEVRKIQDGFKDTIDGYADKAKQYAEEIIKLCERLPAKTREQIRINLDVIQGQLTGNVPFVLKQFTEATTRVVTAAKHEIDQFAQHTLGTTKPALTSGFEDGAKALAAATEPEPEPHSDSSRRYQRARKHITLTDVHVSVEQSVNKTQAFHAEQLANAINGYLQEFQAIEHHKKEPKDTQFCSTCAYSKGPRVYVTYISYQGETALSIDQAEKYLAWLDAGNIGRHFEALR